MDSPAKKRQRLDDSVNPEEILSTSPISNGSASNLEEPIATTIPSLVTQIFIENLKDVKLLKACRLVCKSWNITASNVLKLRSAVLLKESTVGLTEFRTVLLRRAFGPLERLPSPFQNFHVEGVTFTDPNFTNLVRLPNTMITNLHLLLIRNNPELDQVELGSILAANRANITDLNIFGGDEFQVNPELIGNRQIELTALKRFKLEDSCEVCTHILFLDSILTVCQPEKIDLDIRDGDLLTSILRGESVKNVRQLALKFRELSTEAWDHLANLSLPKLKKLRILALDVTNASEHRQQMASLIKNVSPFVEELASNIRIGTESDLVFSKLQLIDMWNNNTLSHFSQRRYPSLTTIMFRVKKPLLKSLENDFDPHPGVAKIGISITDSSSQTSLDQCLLILLTYLSRQFTNVSFLGLTMRKFCSSTFTDICNSFPQLKILRMDGDCDFYSLSGTYNFMVTKYLELGWPIERIPRRKSIMDFAELEAIRFGSKFAIDQDMIIYCLPKIPKLKCVEFHWNETLTASVLRDSLGHLKKIVIANSSESRFQGAMNEVSELIPNVHLC